MIAITIADATGYLSKGIDAALEGMGVSKDSTLEKALDLGIKLIIMILIIVATAGAAAPAEASEAASLGSDGARAGADAADAGAGAADAGAGTADAGADATEESGSASKAADASNAAKTRIAGRMLAANVFASTNPLADLCVLVERAIHKGEANADEEQWIQMTTAIISAIMGMAATFSAGNAMASLTSETSSAGNVGKAITALNKLSALLNLASAGLGGYVADLTYQKAQAEKLEGQLTETNDELKALVAALKGLTDETHQWMKQITATDTTLTNSMEYDEFQNFAHVQLHG